MRTIASLMPDSIAERTIVRIKNNENKFYTHSTKVTFDGFKKV
jgi:DNA topoisomerase IA